MKGIGILLDGCREVTLRNAVVNGYMGGILARGGRGIRLEACDASRNRCERIAGWGQWLDGHALDAWRRSYGAGFLLDKCNGVRMTGCQSLHAQNGILTATNRILAAREDLDIAGRRSQREVQFCFEFGLLNAHHPPSLWCQELAPSAAIS